MLEMSGDIEVLRREIGTTEKNQVKILELENQRKLSNMKQREKRKQEKRKKKEWSLRDLWNNTKSLMLVSKED